MANALVSLFKRTRRSRTAHCCFAFIILGSCGLWAILSFAEPLTLGTPQELLGLPPKQTDLLENKQQNQRKKTKNFRGKSVPPRQVPPLARHNASEAADGLIQAADDALEQKTLPGETSPDGSTPQAEQTVTPQLVQETAKDSNSKKTVGHKPIQLFGSVEFKGPLKNIPKWQRVLTEEKKLPTFDPQNKQYMPQATQQRWGGLKNKLQSAPIMDKLRGVNNFFNQWPYKTDLANWRVEDYWETPREFLQKSGDCEDYAITKYYALRELGVPASQLRVVAVMEKIRGIGHAVLVAFVDDKAYVLDNLTNLVLPHTRLLNYEAKFSVNEEYRWVHIKPFKQIK